MTSHQKYLALYFLMIAALLYSASPALAQFEDFALLAGDAVTCTNSQVTGDVGVDDSTGGLTRTGCPVEGTVYAPGAPAVQAAYDAFVAEYTALNAMTCTSTLTGTLAGQTVTPGVYCVDATAKTGTLTLNAGGDPNAEFIVLVNGALTGTGFNVVMTNGGDPCNVSWQTDGAVTLTNSNVVGTIFSGAAVTVTDGTFDGGLLATDAVTVTGGAGVATCEAAGGGGGGGGNGGGGGGNGGGSGCNQGVGNGPEGCDPGSSNNQNPTNDEDGGLPGLPGRRR